MKPNRIWTPMAVFLTAMGVGSPDLAEAQANRAPAWELALYGGGAYSADWYETRLASSSAGIVTETGDLESFGFGNAWNVGGSATWYSNPFFGMRLHYSYVPSKLPLNGLGGEVLNNHYYDLSLVLRPWGGHDRRILASSYLFLGGGGVTSDPAGDGGCAPEVLVLGSCLSMSGESGTTGQGVAGAGFDLFRMGALGVFFEAAAHFYDSPVHVGDNFVPLIEVTPGETFAVADDMWSASGRYSIGFRYGLGDLMPPPLPPVVVLRPPPPPPPAPPPPPPPAPRAVKVCVVTNSGLAMVDGSYDPTSGATTVSGRPFPGNDPPPTPTYAGGARWFVSSDSLTFNDANYVKFGIVRAVESAQLTRVGEVMGTGVFAESNPAAPQGVVYIPVRPGCEFQPYVLRQTLRPRG